MLEITLRELDAQRARFAELAERARAEGRVCAGASARAALLARKARLYQQRADDYTALYHHAREAAVREDLSGG